jgi:hypothetical protein
MDSAFTARFRLIPNKKKKSGNDCDRYLIIDFTPEDAKDAAKWLLAQAEKCEVPGGSTIRKYSSRTDYDEIPGFTLFGSQWSINPDSNDDWTDGRGTISPRA